MSASTEKKIRQAARVAGTDKKMLAAQEEAKKNAKSKRIKFERQVLAASAAEDDDDEIVDTFTINLNGGSIEVPSLSGETADTKETIIRREIKDFAKNSPDIVAQLLKNWMKDETEE